MTLLDLFASADPLVVGGKAASLARLARGGHGTIPRGVVVPTGCTAEEVASPSMGAALTAAVARLGGRVAVRSSAVDEDGTEASFAGMYDTLLNIDAAGVVDAVQRCLSSSGGERAARYRQQRGGSGGIAVIVQAMVPAEVAGVAFSADPVQGMRGVVVIEAVQGLGERLVSGAGCDTRARVDLLERVACDHDSTLLSTAQAQQLARMVRAISSSWGTEVDVEWAIAAGTLWLLQARPITTALAAAPLTVWVNTNAREILPDVCTPMSAAVVERYVEGLLRPLLAPFDVDVKALKPVGFVAGRTYFSLNAVLGWLRSLPLLRHLPAEVLARLLGGDVAAVKLAAQQLTAAPNALRPQWVRGTLAMLRRLWRHRGGDAQGPVSVLRALNERDRAVVLAKLDDEALLQHLERLLATMWGPADVDATSAAMLGLVAQQVFTAALQRLGISASDAQRVLHGADGALASAAPGRALMALAELARREHLDPRTTTDAAFGQALAAFLDEHGHHCRAECDVHAARWADTPAYIRALVQATMHAVRPATDRASLSTVLRAASPAVRWMRPLLEPVLRSLLRRARAGMMARESVKNEAVRRVALVRQVLQEVGRRATAAGSIDAVDDVFFVAPSALPALLAGETARASVAAARARLAEHLLVEPPDVVVGAWFPSRVAAVPRDERTLVGLAASGGVVEGVVRVVRHHDDVSTCAGEVLVAPFTDPGWTPYFVQAVALVTDFGGVLSHGAIIAREYGLPAVVNTGCATTVLRDGDRVRVDGERGVVLRLDVADVSPRG